MASASATGKAKAGAGDADPTSRARADPLVILGKEGCTVQSLTVSDQHATLLLSHPSVIDGGGEGDGDEGGPAPASKTASSLLKLTLVPFHRALLGSNPVISPEDIERGQLPERNLLEHDPNASAEIVSFLRGYDFRLKSESGAEYSYHAARPNRRLCALVGDGGPAALEDDDDRRNESSDLKAKENESSAGAAASNFGAFDVELISPAGAHQISRAMPSLGHVLVRETPEMYDAIVKPYIQSVVDGGSLAWIKNVIEAKKEKERLLVDHADFVINVDTKWRSHPPPLMTPREEWRGHPSTADLYCLGIVKRDGIACLRDLREGHATMLKEMEEEGLRAIETVYGVERDQVRVFVHYQPQFYHFHMHFTRLENEVGCCVERGHLLSDVVQNLEGDPEYYRKRIITYKLRRGSPLQNLIENHSKE